LGIVKPLLEFWPKSLRGDLCGHGYFSRGGIGRDEFDFINTDGRCLGIAQRFLDLLGEILGLRTAHREGAHQSSKVFERNLAGKVNACLSRLDRDAVEQELIVGYAKQEATVAAKCLLQLAPSGLELALRPLVINSIQPGVLYKNVETMDEGAGGRAAAGIGLWCAWDSGLPGCPNGRLRLSSV
jgi:hypothetical protein